MNIRLLILIASTMLLVSCGKREAQESEDRFPPIFPDYTFTAIPYNIAPLNFELEGAEYVRVDFRNGEEKLLTVTGDDCIEIPEKKWRQMLGDVKGKKLEVIVSAWDTKHPRGVRYKPFTIDVAPDPVDEWIAYRLIEPGYEGWSLMGIYQRNLTSFEEKEVVTNRSDQTKCINCHSFNNYSPKHWMFHIRGENGGTALVKNGSVQKVELNKIGVKRNGAYPMWHPGGRYIVFSSNETRQSFYSEGSKPIEVYDLQSDLILYDTQTQQVLADPRFMGQESWETFPAWSPDGKSLYYCVTKQCEDVLKYNEEIHYSLCRVGFDEATGHFGQQVDTIYDANRHGGSVSFPRISPDGAYLLYTKSGFGTFPIWHKEADLKMVRLLDSKDIQTSILNSKEVESYHAWSSSGRWILFSSRRIDGRYTRLFLAWMDRDGKLYKPFLLPQKSPEYNTLRLKSYNIPEFIKEEATLPDDQIENLFFKKNK